MTEPGPPNGSMLGQPLVITERPTQEDLTIPGGKRISCFICSVPKDPSEFLGDSVICTSCDDMRKSFMDKSITEQQGTFFEQALKHLRKTSVPALPAGVQAAKSIVGATSTELLANLIRKILYLDDSEEEREGKQVNTKALMNAINLYQKAEIAHDAQLTETNSYQGIDPEDLSAALQQHVIKKMTTDESFKRWIITEMIERVPGFLQDVVAIARVRATPTPEVTVL